jgi:hypothetical protein
MTPEQETAFAAAWKTEEPVTAIGSVFKLTRGGCYALAHRLGLPRREHPSKQRDEPALGFDYRPPAQIEDWPADMPRFEDDPRAVAADRTGRRIGPVPRESLPVGASTLAGRWVA